MLQKTIRTSVACQGVGLHTGQPIHMRVHPAPADTGIVFRRVDLNPVVEIPAQYQFIGDTSLSTTVERQGASLSTVEHFLSAIAGLGVDNCVVDVTGPELPIMDGSASPFVFLLRLAGVINQNKSKKKLVITDKVEVSCENKYCCLMPFDGYRVSFSIDFDNQAIARTQQHASFDWGVDSYVNTVSRARTFGFMNQVDYLRAKNKILGASLDNAVVVGDKGVINKEGLRYSQGEFVKHKILDCIGDLALIGHAIEGAFFGKCSGHYMNKLLLDKVMSTGAYQLATG